MTMTLLLVSGRRRKKVVFLQLLHEGLSNYLVTQRAVMRVARKGKIRRLQVVFSAVSLHVRDQGY